MIRPTFIWKESIYKNSFRCSCGNQLADPQTGEPEGHVLVDEENRIIYCDRCHQPVCCFGEIETDLPAGLHGDINKAFRPNN